jgi:hypothetical protein
LPLSPTHPFPLTKKYLGLAGVVINVNLFGAKHRKKTVQWEEVVHCVKAQGLFMKGSMDVIKNKAMALIKYQEVCTLFVFALTIITDWSPGP